MLNRNRIESTKTLAEAVKVAFGVDIDTSQRNLVLGKELMDGDIAKAYDAIGRISRKETYQKIIRDFLMRIDYFSTKLPYQTQTMLEVGSGSGLLAIELADYLGEQVIGIEQSDDMLALANKNLSEKSEEKKKEIKKYWEKLPEDYKPSEKDHKKLEDSNPLFDKVTFRKGSIYDLHDIISEEVDHILCRNTLHRLSNPELAILEMYKKLKTGNKLYIRDLKRDADWRTIVRRIGEQRWQHPELAKDYIGAMAAMLTTDELEQMFNNLNIKKYNITSGSYILNAPVCKLAQQVKEFADEVEYVCVIEKE